jgi:NADH-quinone oxidoreductase subunit H
MTWPIFILVSIIKVALIFFIVMTAAAYTVWLERKLIGRMQNRWGPTRVGPFGLLQPMADGIKFILKEDLTPPYVHKTLFVLAPMIALIPALLPVSLVPVGGAITVHGVTTPLELTGVMANGAPADINIALLLILGITSVGVYGIALAGWSSNSKYALLGSLRASAQMISYEVSLGISLVGVLLIANSLSLREIVNQQAGTWFPGVPVLQLIPRWNVFPQIIAFFTYVIAGYAETNRIPFDLPEAETELVAGYHTEYSSMKFAIFFIAEYANMFTVSCIATTLFLGGWHAPLNISAPAFLPPIAQALMPVFWFVLKVVAFIFVYIWIRGTLPRFRYDQLMSFGWKFLFPLALANVVVTSFVVAYFAK